MGHPENNDPFGYAKYIDKAGINNEKLLQFIALGKERPTNVKEAKLLAEAVGIPEHRASIVAGQWALESGRGKHVGGDFNYFGIKSHNSAMRNRMSKNYGIEVSANEKVNTEEVKNGERLKQKSSFLNFNNPLEAFVGYKAFIETNPRYQNALKSKSSLEYAMELKKAGYATSPSYVNKLKPFVTSVDDSEGWANLADYTAPVKNTKQTRTFNPSVSAPTIKFKPDTKQMEKSLKEWESKEQIVTDSELYPEHHSAKAPSKKNPEIVDNLYITPANKTNFGKLPKLRY